MNDIFTNLGSIAGPLVYVGVLIFVMYLLWRVRGRQPGNTRYSVMIYGSMAGCALLILIGLWIFGLFK